jgi:hypothetical protein
MREEGQHMHDPPPLLALDAEIPRREWGWANEGEIGDPTTCHRGAPACVRFDDLVDRDELIEQDRRLAVKGGLDIDDGVDLTAAQRCDDCLRLPVSCVE